MNLMKISILNEYAAFDSNLPEEIHVLLKLEFFPPSEVTQRPPIHMGLVLDRSGSMAGEKLEMTKQSAIYFMNWLTRRDFLSIIAYDDQVQVLIPHTPLLNKQELTNQIRRLHPGGSTNLSGGMIRGFSEIKGNVQAGHIHRLFLLTDGLANVGITEPPRLVEIVQKNLEKGVALTTLGFGHDFDEMLLKSLADAGGGRFHYVKEPEGLARAFQAEFGELSTLIAQNLEVHVEGEGNLESIELLTDYPHEKKGRKVETRIGDVRAGDVKLALLRMRVDKEIWKGKSPLLLGKIDIQCDTLVGEMECERQSVTLEIPPASETQKPLERNPEVAQEIWICKTAELKLKAAQKMAQGNFKKELEELQEHAKRGEMLGKSPLANVVRMETINLQDIIKQATSSENEQNRQWRSRVSKNWVEESCKSRSSRGIYQKIAGVENITVEIPAKRPEEADDFCDVMILKAKMFGFGTDKLEKVRLAVKEVIDNAIEHGCKGKEDGVVRVKCYISVNYVRTVVSDDGPGFDYPGTLKRQEEHKQEKRGRGRGLLLINHLADRVDYQTKKGTRAEVVIHRQGLEVKPKIIIPVTPETKEGVTIEKTEKPGIVLLRVSGNLAGGKERNLESSVKEVLEHGYCNLILDMSQVGYINSTGIGMFPVIQEKVQGHGGNIVLLNLTDRVLDLLDAMGILTIFPPVCHTIESAMEFFT